MAAALGGSMPRGNRNRTLGLAVCSCWLFCWLLAVALPGRALSSEEGAARAGIGPDRLQEAFPPAPATLTLEQLEAIALAENPTLAQAAMRHRATQWECVQAELYPNPAVAYSAEEMNDAGTAGKQGAALSQEIVTADKRRLRSQAASWRVQQAMYTWQAQRHRVLNDVRTRYYRVLVGQGVVALKKQLVEVADGVLRASEQLLEAQELSRVDLMQARIESSSARVSLTDAENRLQAAWGELAAVVGRPELDMVRLEGDPGDMLPELSFEESWRRLLASSPELRRAEAGVQQANWEYRHQCAERVPNLDVGASVHYDNVGQGTVAGVEVGLSLPLFDRNQGNIGKAQAEVVIARREVQRVRLALRQRLSETFERYANALQEARRYREQILPDAEESLALVEKGYRQGELGYLTALTAQRTYFRVNLAYLQSLNDLWSAAVAIDGMFLSGGLDPLQP